MIKRPTSISVIAWLNIVSAGFNLITSTLSFNDPKVNEIMAKSLLPIPLQHVMLYVGLLIGLITGIAMLKGLNWARLFYVIWGVIGTGIGIITSPMKAAFIPVIVFFGVVIFFLFRPNANEYFHNNGYVNDAQDV